MISVAGQSAKFRPHLRLPIMYRLSSKVSLFIRVFSFICKSVMMLGKTETLKKESSILFIIIFIWLPSEPRLGQVFIYCMEVVPVCNTECKCLMFKLAFNALIANEAKTLWPVWSYALWWWFDHCPNRLPSSIRSDGSFVISVRMIRLVLNALSLG